MAAGLRAHWLLKSDEAEASKDVGDTNTTPKPAAENDMKLRSER